MLRDRPWDKILRKWGNRAPLDQSSPLKFIQESQQNVRKQKENGIEWERWAALSTLDY